MYLRVEEVNNVRKVFSLRDNSLITPYRKNFQKKSMQYRFTMTSATKKK